MNTKHTLPQLLILAIALILVGCGGEPSPTPEPPTGEAPTVEAPTLEVDNTALTPEIAPTVEATGFNPFPTLEIPLYPTVAETPFPTPDPALPPVPTEEVLPPPTTFDRVVLIRTGGPVREDGTTADEVIIINRIDGSISRGETQTAITPSVIQRVTDLINNAQFFTVDGAFLGAVPAEPPLPFMYNITVISGDYERSINAQEGYMSPELQLLVATVLSEGQRVPNP